MRQALISEWLKSKRTSSYLLAFSLVVLGCFWEILASGDAAKHSGMAALLSNQTAFGIILPLAIALFTAKLASNEHAGNAFFLPLANGYSYGKIFLGKLALSLLYMTVLLLFKVVFLVIYTSLEAIPVLWGALMVSVLGNFIAFFSLTCFYLTLAIVIDKQGILLGAGFIGMFFGIIGQAWTSYIWSWWLSFTSASYLVPFLFHYEGEQKGHALINYIATPHLGLRFSLGLLLAVISFGLAYSLMQRKKGD